MSTTVKRKTVSYTIPDSPSADSHVERSWYKTVIDIMLTNLNELDSLDAYEANEEARKTDNTLPPVKQLNGITDTTTKKDLESARTRILTKNSPLYASDVNVIATSLNKIYARAKSGSSAATVSKDEIVKNDNKLSTFISTCIEISESLDPKAQAVWGDDGTCAAGCERSCEIKCESVCQIGCEIACNIGCEIRCENRCDINCNVGCEISCTTSCMTVCQYCYSGTCHNQHCGSGF